MMAAESIASPNDHKDPESVDENINPVDLQRSPAGPQARRECTSKSDVRIKVEETNQASAISSTSGSTVASQQNTTGLKWDHVRREQQQSALGKAGRKASRKAGDSSASEMPLKSGAGKLGAKPAPPKAPTYQKNTAEHGWRRQFYKTLSLRDSALRHRLSSNFSAIRKSSLWADMTDEQQIEADKRQAIATIEKWLKEQNDTGEGKKHDNENEDMAKTIRVLGVLREQGMKQLRKETKEKHRQVTKEREQEAKPKKLAFEAEPRANILKSSPAGWRTNNPSDFDLNMGDPSS